MVRVDAADGHDLLDLGDADLAGGRHRLVEVARGLAEDEVAALVRLPALDDGEIGANAALQDIILAVEILHFLALGHFGADTGPGVEAGNAGAARAAALGQCPLRAEFHLELAGQILPLELLVLSHVGGDHLLHLARAEQFAEPFPIDSGIVAGDGEILHAGGLDRVDQPLRNPAQAEPARADRHAVEQQALQRGGGVGIDFLHARAPSCEEPIGGAGESGQAKLNEVSTCWLASACTPQAGRPDTGLGAGRVVRRRLPGDANCAEPFSSIGGEYRDATRHRHHLRGGAEAGCLARGFRHCRRREAPSGCRQGLRKGEVHDAITIAVHPKRGNDMAAGVDHGNRVTLLPRGRMEDAARDDRLCGARIEPRSRLRPYRRGQQQSENEKGSELHATPPRAAHRRER